SRTPPIRPDNARSGQCCVRFDASGAGVDRNDCREQVSEHRKRRELLQLGGCDRIGILQILKVVHGFSSTPGAPWPEVRTLGDQRLGTGPAVASDVRSIKKLGERSTSAIEAAPSRSGEQPRT